MASNNMGNAIYGPTIDDRKFIDSFITVNRYLYALWNFPPCRLSILLFFYFFLF